MVGFSLKLATLKIDGEVEQNFTLFFLQIMVLKDFWLKELENEHLTSSKICNVYLKIYVKLLIRILGWGTFFLFRIQKAVLKMNPWTMTGYAEFVAVF